MDARDWFFRQLVTSDELDGAFDDVEDADHYQNVDADLVGIMSGLEVTENDTPDLSVKVAIGTAYDKTGKRIRVTPLQYWDITYDETLTPTLPPAGDERIVSIFAKFKRVESDPRTDGNSNTVYFIQSESFELVTRMGSAVTPPTTPTPPSLDSEAILLCDILRTNPQTQILDSDIDLTTRREEVFRLSTASLDVLEGTAEEMGQALLDEIEAIVAGGAAQIGYTDGSGGWADTTGISATNVQDAIDEIVDDLADNGSASGAGKLGFQAAQSSWRDTTQLAATDVQAAIDEIVDSLAKYGLNNDGGRLVGYEGNSNTYFSIASGDVRQALNTLADEIDEIETPSDGAKGAALVGFNPTGNIAATNVQAAIAEVDSEKGGLALGNTWTGSNTFSGLVKSTYLAAGSFTGYETSLYARSFTENNGSGTHILYALSPSNGTAGFVKFRVFTSEEDDSTEEGCAEFDVGYAKSAGGTVQISIIDSTHYEVSDLTNVSSFSVTAASGEIRLNIVKTGATGDLNHVIWVEFSTADLSQAP